MAQRSASKLLFGLSLACLACTPTGDNNAQAKAKAEAKPAAPASEVVPPAVEAAPPTPPAEVTPTPTDPLAPPTEVAPPPEVTPPAEPIPVELVPIVPIASTPMTAPWRSAATPSEPLTLVDLSAGVLAKGASDYYQLGEDGQLALASFEAAGGPIFGVWPSDAWCIEQRDKVGKDERGSINMTELRLMRLRGGDRWVPQAYGGEQRFVDNGQDFRKSSHSGLLVEYEGEFTRIASNTGDPERGDRRGYLVDHLETTTGKIYPITKQGELTFVQVECEDEACVTSKSRQLPLTGTWEFAHAIARQRNSVSSLATAASRSFVLHFETGGWKLEEASVDAVPSGMWATKDGGMWTVSGELLRHRDPDGVWHDVALPEGLSGLSVAIREDRSELWIAGSMGGSPVVFATHANAQDPAPAPEPAPAG